MSYPTSVDIDPADAARANEILQPLDDKKLEWRNLSMDKRKDFLRNIGLEIHPFLKTVLLCSSVVTIHFHFQDRRYPPGDLVTIGVWLT